jgi:hypothetical protein
MAADFSGADAEGAWMKEAYEALETTQVLFLCKFGAAMCARAGSATAVPEMPAHLTARLPYGEPTQPFEADNRELEPLSSLRRQQPQRIDASGIFEVASEHHQPLKLFIPARIACIHRQALDRP